MQYQPEAESVAAFALSQAREELSVLNEDWRSLEVKAQGTVAAAGILVTALSVAIDKLRDLHVYQVLGLRVAIAFLMMTTIAALLSMLLRRIKQASTAKDALDEVEKIGLDQLGLDQRWINAQVDLLRKMVEANQAIRDALIDRAFYLSAAHVALAVATACLFTVFLTLSMGRT